MSTSLIFSSLTWHGAAIIVNEPAQTQDNVENPGVKHQFATWLDGDCPIRSNSDRVCVRDSKLTFGQLFFSRRDNGGNLILEVDGNGLRTLLPGPDTSEHRISLLPEPPIGSVWEGRPMGHDVTIFTCGRGKRPRFLYRAIHSGYAGCGLEARGMNIVQPDSLDFQVHLENHLDWYNRKPSPFLSATSDRSKAMRLCEMFVAQHRTGVQLLAIDSWKQGWEHNTQRLWDLTELVHAFGLERKAHYSDEYLIEQSIPWESVLFRMDWDEMEGK